MQLNTPKTEEKLKFQQLSKTALLNFQLRITELEYQKLTWIIYLILNIHFPQKAPTMRKVPDLVLYSVNNLLK